MRVNVYIGRAGALFSAGVSAGVLRSRLWIALQDHSPSDGVDGEEWEACAGPHVRDVLDSAVRALAVGPGPILDRVRVAGSTLSGGLSRTDFLDDEDLALFDRIVLGFLELDLIAEETGGTVAAEVQRALASDIVDLRDGLAGRAMHDLRVSTGRGVPPLD